MVTERHQKQPQMRGIGSNEAASRIDTSCRAAGTAPPPKLPAVVRPSLGIEINGLSHRKREARVTTVSTHLTSPWRRATRWDPLVPRHGRYLPPVVLPLFEARGYG